MAWVAVPNILELREQVNKIAPDRDKDSDGIIGDYKHQQGRSSHNPDDTSHDNAEWDGDSDSTPEVRAIDIDIDFREPGVTASKLVAHLIKYAKNGTFWWIRYIIFNKKIYHKRDGFAARAYNGSNPHDKHIHVNSDFTQAADTVKNVNYRLNELKGTVEDDDMTPAELAAELNDTGSSLHQAFRRIAWQYPAQTNKSALAVFNETHAMVSALAAQIASEGTNPTELQKALDAIPTAEENAEAVVEALGGANAEDLAETLRTVLGPEKTAALKAAL